MFIYYEKTIRRQLPVNFCISADLQIFRILLFFFLNFNIEVNKYSFSLILFPLIQLCVVLSLISLNPGKRQCILFRTSLINDTMLSIKQTSYIIF